MSAIKENDICEFPAWALGPNVRKLEIVWQQDMEPRKEWYTLILVDYPVVQTQAAQGSSSTETTITKGRARLFIAEDKLDVFKAMLSNSKSNDIETHKFTVTRDFLYGQENAEGKNRFLVLHDKKRNPYQHRFVPSQYVRFGEGSLKKLKKAGFGSERLDLVGEHAKALVGDPLRDFSGKERPASGLASLRELFD